MKKILILMAVLSNSFNEISGQKLNVIDITSAPKITMQKLSDIATDVEYIPLETNENSLIERVINLRVQNNYIYIGTLNSVLCFNRSGKFLFSLNKQGRGPDEYEFLLDFEVNANNTILAIPSRKDIVLYNQTEKGFAFFKRVNISSPSHKIDFVGKSDRLLLQFSNYDGLNPFSKQLINLNGDILESWPNYMTYKKTKAKVWVGHTFENTSYHFQNNVFLKALGNDSIFKLNENNKMEAFLILDTKNRRITPEVRANTKFYAEHLNEFIVMQKIYGSERFFYYTYEYNKKTAHEIYDQINNIRYGVPEKEFLKDDIAGGVNFAPEYCNDGLFYSWTEAIKFKSYISSDSFKKAKVKNSAKYDALKSLSLQVTDFDNPIIIVAKVK